MTNTTKANVEKKYLDLCADNFWLKLDIWDCVSSHLNISCHKLRPSKKIYLIFVNITPRHPVDKRTDSQSIFVAKENHQQNATRANLSMWCWLQNECLAWAKSLWRVVLEKSLLACSTVLAGWWPTKICQLPHQNGINIFWSSNASDMSIGCFPKLNF